MPKTTDTMNGVHAQEDTPDFVRCFAAGMTTAEFYTRLNDETVLRNLMAMFSACASFETLIAEDRRPTLTGVVVTSHAVAAYRALTRR